VRSLVSSLEVRRNRFAYWTVLIVVTVVFFVAFIFPLYWMVTGALKTPVELAQPKPTLVPHHWQFGTYVDAWRKLQIGRFLLNTTLYALGGWLFQLIVDVAAAYALSKLRPVLGRLVLGAMLAGLLMPITALLVPAYLTVTDLPVVHLNLLNTPWALWLPGAANAFNIYVLKRFFDQIPDELLDAAEVDGAGRLRILWSIVLPLSRPVLAVVSIFAVVGAWKDFLWPLLVLPDPDGQTVSVALSRLSFTGYVTQNEMFAGLAMASVPMVIVFAVFQRHILSGLSAGALK
jgi:multiple sugar transport system permease protein